LSVEKGEFVAIVGASGSGKSTLLQLIGGLDRPTSGNVFIDGENIYDYNEEKLAIFRRRKIGFIFQFFNLIPVLTVEENISLPALIDHDKVDKAYLNELIDILGLSNRRNHLPSELSGGQQQRVAIGRALLNKPSIILADEPTGNLDSKHSKDIIELLKFTAKKYNQTILLITHDIQIAEMADRIVTIQDGEIISDQYLQRS
jgi:putative ABC transport system ATP-binding protein